MLRILLVNFVLIFSLTACNITPPKPISKEIKWEAEEEVIADAKVVDPEASSADLESQADKTQVAEENSDTKPTPTVSPKSATPKATPTPKIIKPSISHNGATVYVTKSGKKFHREDCTALSKSKIPLLFEEASKKGYTPCGLCKP